MQGDQRTLRCAKCGAVSYVGTRYCPRCGDPLAPELVSELQWLYRTLGDLDARIAAGEGDRTMRALHDDYVTRYKTLRAPQPAPPALPSVGFRDLREPSPTPPPLASPLPLPAIPLVAAPPAEPGPIFSWRAFFAEQSIAILAYLGGFLLLVATLSFELGAGLQIGDTPKLIVVLAVYAIFGALGLSLFRVQRLRTVGNAYLGVFALMTPLVGLAFYLFALHGLGLPAAGMLCISSIYATFVYEALAWRTNFFTYAVLGGTTLAVAAMASVPWSQAAPEWYGVALAGAALALLATWHLPLPQVIGRAGLMLASIVSPLAALVMGRLVIRNWALVAGYTSGIPLSAPGAAAIGSLLLLPLGMLWSITLRALEVRRGDRPPGSASFADYFALMDGLVAAIAALAAVGVAIWVGADARALVYVLAGTAVAESGAALVLRLIAHERQGVRYSVHGVALAVSLIAVISGWNDPAIWPAIAGLGAFAASAFVVAFAEAAPYMVTLAGLAFAAAFWDILRLMPSPPQLGQPGYEPALLTSRPEVAFTIAVWLVAMLCTLWAPARRYAMPVYLVALGNALWTLLLLLGLPQYPLYQGIAIGGFGVLGYLAGLRDRQPIAGGTLLAIFGGIAMLPLQRILAPANVTAPDDLAQAIIALAPLAVGIAVRRLLGRNWEWGWYSIAGWGIALAATQFTLAAVFHTAITPIPAIIGTVPYAAWLLIAAALLAILAAWQSERPYAMLAPGLLLLAADGITPSVTSNHMATTVIALAGVAAGLGVRFTRGRDWALPWYGMAIAASIIAVSSLADQGVAAPYWQAGLLLGYGVIAYIVAQIEDMPLATIAAAGYGIAAALILPRQNLPGWDLLDGYGGLPTLALVAAGANAGVVLGRIRGISWATAAYAIALAASFAATGRIVPYDAGHLEVTLLLFAALGYAVAALERQPWAGAAVVIYASWAAAIQPDPHALLALALLLALAGLVAGRFAGLRWSWSAYAAAIVAGMLASFNTSGGSDFQALALGAIAAAVYIVAAVEARPDALAPAFLLGALGLGVLSAAQGWTIGLEILLYALLGWAYAGLQFAWQTIPWLRPRAGQWWAGAAEGPTWLHDPRVAGVVVHRWASVVVVGGATLVAATSRSAFAIQGATTQSTSIAMLTLAALLILYARLVPLHVLWYIAGEVLALFLTWELRWLGVDNIQAFILAPGSYLILIGALLPSDERLRRPVIAGQVCSVLGSLILLLPTLGQSFLNDQSYLYAFILAAEALVITGIGLGTRTRILLLTGVGFVGLAALRSSIVAINSGIPVALVIAIYAVLLMGAATWLSLRARR